VVVPKPRMSVWWAELALTGAGLATAGALGVFFAVDAMEGAVARWFRALLLQICC
jgi:hypothetical protein